MWTGSGVSPGRGTNKNERLHRDINAHMTSTRYGVELAYALLTKIFFGHNERIESTREQRSPRPITACDRKTNERFGLSTPSDNPQDQVCFHPSIAKVEMRKLTLPEVLELLNTISIANYGVESLQLYYPMKKHY